MVDDFHKPLGQKPEPPTKQEKSGNGVGRWTGVLGLCAGLIAIGLFGWQTYFTPKTIAPSGEQIAQVDNTVNTPEPENETGNSDETRTTENVGTGVTGLTEIEPDGVIAVPKPRPPKAKPQEIGLAHLPDPDLIERGASGVIPKRSTDGKRPMDVYAREADTTGNFGVARVVLIVGGMGVSQTSSQLAIRKLPPTVTLAYAPYGNSLQRWMQSARKKGHELLLQLPMESFGAPASSSGAHTLVASASPEENLANLHWLLSRLTNYVGVMSFQGGKLLSDAKALKPIFDDLAERGLLFIDEGIAGNSKSKQIANLSILPNATAHIHIDSKRSRRDIAEKMDLLVKEAKRTGVAIGVSSGFSETIEMLSEFAKKASELGIEITPVSAIVEDLERDR